MLNFKHLLLSFLIFFVFLNPIFGQKKNKTVPYYVQLEIDSNTQQYLKISNTQSFCKKGLILLEDYPKFSQQIVSYFENNGFPFAEVYLDNLILEEDKGRAVLRIFPHEYIVYDSVIVVGNAKLSTAYFYPYLGWRRGKPYRENVVREIPTKIAELPFVTETRASSVEFVNDKCYLYLYLDHRKSCQFDGYIGIVPVDERTGKVSVNGEVNLDLKNLFKIGEQMAVQWRSTERFSQFLTVHLNFPYLFRTPLGVDGQFILDKKDTSYLSMNYNIGLQYSFLGNSYAKVYFNYESSNVLSSSLLSVSLGSELMDYRKTMYGVEFNINRLDYLFNPRKGFSLKINGSLGQRKIVKNARAEEHFYDDVEMKKSVYQFNADLRGYIPLHRRWVLALGVNGGSIFSNQLYKNELFRIGGMNSLQGFDEKDIYCSSYAIAVAEIRFLFAKRSYVNAFFNGAWYERRLTNGYFRDLPFGFGLGLSFDTKVGMFYLSYALGKQLGNPISFKTGKIHFGIKVGF